MPKTIAPQPDTFANPSSNGQSIQKIDALESKQRAYGRCRRAGKDRKQDAKQHCLEMTQPEFTSPSQVIILRHLTISGFKIAPTFVVGPGFSCATFSWDETQRFDRDRFPRNLPRSDQRNRVPLRIPHRDTRQSLWDCPVG